MKLLLATGITGNKFGLPSPAVLLEAGAFPIGTETVLILKAWKKDLNSRTNLLTML